MQAGYKKKKKVSSAAQVDVIGPFLEQPGPHTGNLCLSANSEVGHAH